MTVKKLLYKERKGITMDTKKKKKLIIYGMGKLFRKYKQHILWDNVIACTDKTISTPELYDNNIPVIPLQEISKKYFDYIVIFVDEYFDNIRVNLMGYYDIPEDKMISWRVFFNKSPRVSYEMVDFLKNYIKETRVKKLLDVGMRELPNFFICRQQLEKDTFVEIDGIGECGFPLYGNLYHHIYHSFNQVRSKYDMLFLDENFEEYLSWNDILEAAHKYIIWGVPYLFQFKKSHTEFIQKSEKFWINKKYRLPDKIMYVFEKKRDVRLCDCKIFVVTHKKYNVKHDLMYQPIYVGDQYQNKEYLNEHIGENIAYLNDRINECTALYWMWKNGKSEYIGLNHYRRYFYNNRIKHSENYLSIETVSEIFESDYDIILPEAIVLSRTLLDNIAAGVGEELRNQGLEIVQHLIKRMHPDYMDAFEYAMNGHLLYMCNMFVTHRRILNQYCEWLFSFLIDGAELLDVSSCDSQGKRTMGYFAETLWTVWLLKQKLRIFELPIVSV